MNRRQALAGAAAISLSITAFAAAAGATMHVFDVADASPNLGKVSPVGPPTSVAPKVEGHVLYVDEPAPAPPTPAPADSSPATGTNHPSGGAQSSRPDDTRVSASASTVAPSPTTPPATHPHEVERELGDD